MNSDKISYQVPFGLRMPPAMRAWVNAKAKRNMSSMNKEILLCIRDKMEKEKGLAAEAAKDSDGGTSLVASTAVTANRTSVEALDSHTTGNRDTDHECLYK